jgi:iron transport multicopper oxidase
VHSYDDEYTVVLGDWYHTEHDVLLKQFISVSNPGGAEPVPGRCLVCLFCGNRICSSEMQESGLMYFVHNATYLPPVPGTSPSGATSAVGFNENATLPFVPGRTYRLRIINTSALAAFFFWIDGHEMRIIEADGVSMSSSRFHQDLLFSTEGCSTLP